MQVRRKFHDLRYAYAGMYLTIDPEINSIYKVTGIDGRDIMTRHMQTGQTNLSPASTFEPATKEQLKWAGVVTVTYKSLVERIEQTIDDPKIPRREKLNMIEEFLTNNLDRVEE